MLDFSSTVPSVRTESLLPVLSGRGMTKVMLDLPVPRLCVLLVYTLGLHEVAQEVHPAGMPGSP